MTLEVVQWNQFQHGTMEIPWGLGGAQVQLLSSFCYSVGTPHNLPPTQGDFCDRINSSINNILCVLTRLLTSLPTPGHMNLSVTRASVLFVPKWPEVGPLWHSLSNWTLVFIQNKPDLWTQSRCTQLLWMCRLLHYFNDTAYVYRGQRVYPYTLFCLYNGGSVAIETV